MPKLPWLAVSAWLLAAFFLIGAIGNTFVSDEIAADYARWGYPGWFHYVTAALELSVGVLIARYPTRLNGLALGTLIMAAAAGTVLFHGELTHAIPPLVVLVLCVAVGAGLRRSRLHAAEGVPFGR